jgi:hypothetical protein
MIFAGKCAHGINSGLNYATIFSNQQNTNKSSLGTFVIFNTYYGSYFKYWALEGISKSNNYAFKRHIIIHSSQKMKTNWSWGCFSIPQGIMDKLYLLNLESCYLIAYK